MLALCATTHQPAPPAPPAGTLDEKMYQRQLKKGDIAATMMGGGGSGGEGGGGAKAGGKFRRVAAADAHAMLAP